MTGARSPAVHRLVTAAGITAVVLVVFGLAELAQHDTGTRHRTLLWLLATVCVAVAVPLVRPRLGQLADRVAYGPGGDPYAYISAFAERIGATLAVDDVLPQVARTATQAVHSPRGEVRLWLADGGEWRQTWPPQDPGAASGRQVEVALRHAGDAVGQLGVATTEELSDDARRLLDLLAAPAGLALSNVRLTMELRRRLQQAVALAGQLEASRLRLLQTAAGERRRFAAAVEDRVLRPLAAADELLATADGDPERLTAVRAEAVTALEALRDLAAGVFLPALHDRGLLEALELGLQRDWSQAVLDAEPLRDIRLPAEVESAAYFCVMTLLAALPATPPATVSGAVTADRLELRVSAAAPMEQECLLLADDRVAALGGTVSSAVVAGRHVITVALPAGAT